MLHLALSAWAPLSMASPSKTILYASLGAKLLRYDLDAPNATLTPRETITAPENVQYAVANSAMGCLYVASSNAGSGTSGAAGDKHFLGAYRIDPSSGALRPQGDPVSLPERPIHLSVDRAGHCAIVAFNQSGTVRVYKIKEDGAVAGEVPQSSKPDGGIFTHQAVFTPAEETVIALGRGNDATKTKPADPGSRTTFRFRQGLLSQIGKTAYEDGIGPRHLAFHPSQPWAYVAIERGSKIFMHRFSDGILSEQPLFKKETLADLANVHRDRQKGGVINIHPNGRVLYVTNRADGTASENGKTVWGGGENNIAVFAIDQKTGEPTLIQHIDCRGIEARTFAIDPSGQLLVVANQKTMLVRDGGNFKTVTPNLALFRIRADGTLEFVRKYDVDTGGEWLLWMDIVAVK